MCEGKNKIFSGMAVVSQRELIEEPESVAQNADVPNAVSGDEEQREKASNLYGTKLN